MEQPKNKIVATPTHAFWDELRAEGSIKPGDVLAIGTNANSVITNTTADNEFVIGIAETNAFIGVGDTYAIGDIVKVAYGDFVAVVTVENTTSPSASVTIRRGEALCPIANGRLDESGTHAVAYALEEVILGAAGDTAKILVKWRK